MRTNRIIFILVLFWLFPLAAMAGRQNPKSIVLLVQGGDSLIAQEALKGLNKVKDLGSRWRFSCFTEDDIRKRDVQEDVRKANIVLADFMNVEYDLFLSKLLGEGTRVYSLRCGYLAEKLRKRNILPALSTEQYYQPATIDNIKNLILMVLCKEGEDLSYNPPFILPRSGIFHPKASNIFSSFGEYLKWYRNEGLYNGKGFWVGIHSFSTSAVKSKGKIEACLVRTLEKEGINVLPIFGRPPYHKSLVEFFLDERNRPRVDAIVSFAARFLRGFPEKTIDILGRINAPLFIPLHAHAITITQWRNSATGISPIRVAWQVCTPEENGGIEPTIVGGKRAVGGKHDRGTAYDLVPMEEEMRFLVKRIKAWHDLKVRPNREKKLAVLYWNHPPGKQNVGASYMNCFGSIAVILKALKEHGYKVDRTPNGEEIREMILLSARNIASWAPGELERLLAYKKAAKIPIQVYQKWFEQLDTEFRKNVIRQWGRPEESKIMTVNNEIIIPVIRLGNIILAPQPNRGFCEDPVKLYHDPKIYPHHQYIAFYLWLKKKFRVDAIISLGKHGTHEWLPGKQIGLSLSCPPEVLIQDIPNIYPYIVDNIGEGIQAKRRGRGVIVDHLTPSLRKGGLYEEYRRLSDLIDQYHDAKAKDESLARKKLDTVKELIRKLGLDRDLGLSELNDEAVEKIEHYLLELQERLIPDGLHTFGVSPDGDSLKYLTEAVSSMSPEIRSEQIRSILKECGKRELASLLRALEGGYVPPGQGNDPVRNPEALPTGRNFYGFSVDKVPSKEAYSMGKEMADKMIKDFVDTHGRYPEKIGIILWSTELQRNEGASVGAILNLLGITPVWDKKGKVVDIRPIAGRILKRPRIDVLVQTSGLFRDSYARIIRMIDKAVRMAASLRDVENFVSINSKKVEAALARKGCSKEKACVLSKTRVFGPMPGAYVHAIQSFVPNSGVWDTDQEIADLFIHHYSFGYGEDLWGKALEGLYKENLRDVKLTVHTRSSNLYYMLDNDDMYAFLGGLSLAVKTQAGQYPDIKVANLQTGKDVIMEDLIRSIGKALRTRYLNPRWIKGMKKEGYAGARQMDKFVEYLWGFQVTTPFAVDKTQWRQVYEVYIKDKYRLGLKDFFDKNNPWAEQSIAARMLEAIRKGYWNAPEETKKDLAKTYVLDVIQKGVACCEHTCNNPMLQEFVTNIISLYGLLLPQQMDRFKTVLSKATGKTQEENQRKNREVRESLVGAIKNINKEKVHNAETKGKSIQGFEMVEEKPENTRITSSGSSWVVMAIVVGFLTLVCFGWVKSRRW